MRRGEVWTVAGGKDYASKPRPVAIVQDDAFEALGSVTVCAFTTDPTEAALFRLEVAPTLENGLREPSRLMIDKLTTVPREKLGKHVGKLSDADMLRFDRAAIVFLGLAGQPASAA
ncbi:MAG: growth inhibitor PemK [Sphingomonadales bacterium 32-68-7]|nr:MAG: growth inhibitor PemK [Sphingomonadales bacterium 12-68-11]OYX08669.1 MAG: growth inhibitor PemK [Sphingomonadales bacterium 32-68-7]